MFSESATGSKSPVEPVTLHHNDGSARNFSLVSHPTPTPPPVRLYVKVHFAGLLGEIKSLQTCRRLA